MQYLTARLLPRKPVGDALLLLHYEAIYRNVKFPLSPMTGPESRTGVEAYWRSGTGGGLDYTLDVEHG
jgi:hypothetical protein